jgi:hypothetical protein
MDPGSAILGLGVMAGLVLITGLVTRSLVQYAKLRADSRQGGAEVLGEIAGLRDQVDELRHQLIETQERLDFTERLLTKGRNEPREVG